MALPNLQTYRLNQNVKAPGQEIEYSKEQVEQFAKAALDHEYFAKQFVMIQTPDKGLTDFDPYEYQLNIMNNIMDNRHTIFLLPRQSGKCVSADAIIKVRNKKTGEVREVAIGEFYEELNI